MSLSSRVEHQVETCMGWDLMMVIIHGVMLVCPFCLICNKRSTIEFNLFHVCLVLRNITPIIDFIKSSILWCGNDKLIHYNEWKHFCMDNI